MTKIYISFVFIQALSLRHKIQLPSTVMNERLVTNEHKILVMVSLLKCQYWYRLQTDSIFLKCSVEVVKAGVQYFTWSYWIIWSKLSESHCQSFSVFWSGCFTKLELGWGVTGCCWLLRRCSDTPVSSSPPAYTLPDGHLHQRIWIAAQLCGHLYSLFTHSVTFSATLYNIFISGEHHSCSDLHRWNPRRARKCYSSRRVHIKHVFAHW